MQRLAAMFPATRLEPVRERIGPPATVDIRDAGKSLHTGRLFRTHPEKGTSSADLHANVQFPQGIKLLVKHDTGATVPNILEE